MVEIKDINDKISAIEKAVEQKKEDPNFDSLILGLLSGVQDPIHNMILSWNDWYLTQNPLGAPDKWEPEKNPVHMVKSEVSDVYKAMTKIRMLEAKLKNFDMNSGKTNEDWNLLNSLKRELGIPVEFANEKKAEGKKTGEGVKTVAALS